MLESFDSLIAWLAQHPEWLGWAIFLVACIECLALAGILVPGVAILFGLGVLALALEHANLLGQAVALALQLFGSGLQRFAFAFERAKRVHVQEELRIFSSL